MGKSFLNLHCGKVDPNFYFSLRNGEVLKCYIVGIFFVILHSGEVLSKTNIVGNNEKLISVLIFPTEC